MKRKIIAVLTLAVVLMSLVLSACSVSPEKAIIGKWKSRASVLGVVTETEYVFYEDGTGVKSNVIDVEFTYAIEEDELTIITGLLGVEREEVYTFEFEKDILTLSNDSETIKLEKEE